MILADDPVLLGIRQQIDARPEDWQLRRVLADYHEDRGDWQTAEAIRWQADNEYRAMPGADDADYGWFEVYEGKTRGQHGDPESDLPSEVWHNLEGFFADGACKDYRTNQEADEALWQAYKKGRGLT